jgi:hypothetical protein
MILGISVSCEDVLRSFALFFDNTATYHEFKLRNSLVCGKCLRLERVRENLHLKNNLGIFAFFLKICWKMIISRLQKLIEAAFILKFKNM